MIFIFAILVFLVLFSPGILIVATPVRWLRLTVSVIVLGLGLLWLDEHIATVAPYDDDGPFHGIFSGIILYMDMAVGVGVMLRGYALILDDEDKPRSNIDQLWPVPMAMLAASLFMHWLSNRLAGAQPPMPIHIGLIAAALVVAALFGFISYRWPRFRPVTMFITVFAATIAAMVAGDAAKGLALWRSSKQEAGNNPHCIMTYGGFEHRRVARDGWDLSPLVNRHYGNWAAGKAPLLIYKDREKLVQLRLHWGEFLEGGLGPPPCLPH